MRKQKQGYRIEDLLPIALMFGVAVIGIAITADVIDNVQDDQVANSAAYNVSADGLEAMTELGSWTPTIALVVAAAIIIGILVYSFAFKN